MFSGGDGWSVEASTLRCIRRKFKKGNAGGVVPLEQGCIQPLKKNFQGMDYINFFPRIYGFKAFK